MSLPEQFDAKVMAEGEIYFTPAFWKGIHEAAMGTLEEILLSPELIEIFRQPMPLYWKDIRDYDLSEARKNFRINDFPDEGDVIFVISYTGKAEVKFDSPNADSFDLETYKKIKHTYTDIYLTNEAQDGATIKILFGRGDWDLIETYPEIDLSGKIRNDYLEPITDPLNIGQIISDGHIVPHADIACEKILITGTTRLDQWRSTDDYTYIAPGMILLHATAVLSDWQHPANMTYIHGGQIYTESIVTAALAAGAVTAEKMTITDLADIVNLLTVAEGKILIGENVLGADLHGIKIVDEQVIPVTRVAIGHLAAGIANYGLTVRDEDGNVTVDLGRLRGVMKSAYSSSSAEQSTNVVNYVDIAGTSAGFNLPIAGCIYIIGYIRCYEETGSYLRLTINLDGVDLETYFTGEYSEISWGTITAFALQNVAAGPHTAKLRWKVGAGATAYCQHRGLAIMAWYT